MRIILITVVVFLLILLSCNSGSDNIGLLESKGLNGDNLRFNTLLFCNDSIGFIAGSSDIVSHNPDFPKKDKNQFAFLKRRSLLFKTTDGGKTWVKKDFGEGR